MSKDLLVLADEYAAATATFARALALKDEADSMSPIAREAGDKRAVLAEALAALDTAQQEPVNAMLVEALERMVESVTGVDQVSAVNEARAALTAAKQAQPEPSDLRGIDAGPVAEWVDLVKRGYVSRDECLIAVKDIPLWIAKNSEQAQPPAPSDTAITYMTGYSDCKKWAGATNQAQPSQAVELPERWVSESSRGHESQTYGLGYKSGWNDCLSQVAAINAKEKS